MKLFVLLGPFKEVPQVANNSSTIQEICFFSLSKQFNQSYCLPRAMTYVSNQNVSSLSIGSQDVSSQNISRQDINSQDVSLQDISSQYISIMS